MPAVDTEILYARQPIYDRSKQLAGYELLFRSNSAANAAPKSFDGNVATSRVLINAFSETHVGDICDWLPVYVNFTAETLDNELPFPPCRLVVEVLESVEPTSDVSEALTELSKRGHRIALDDYNGRDGAHPLLEYADIVKLDYPQYAADDVGQAVSALRQRCANLTVLAEKVETHDDFACCVEAGCDLFQGYFLARPELIHGQPLPVDRVRVMELLAAINDSNRDTESIADMIRHDAFLSLRLLKIANSAYYYNIGEVTSLTRATMALGTVRIRAFASLLALSKLENKPRALHYVAATRGFICQILAEKLRTTPEMGFTVGLFSCLDAFFDRSLEDVLSSIPFNTTIVNAVLYYRGALGTVLRAIIIHEQGLLDQMPWGELAALDITTEQFMNAFHEGIHRANIEYFHDQVVA